MSRPTVRLKLRRLAGDGHLSVVPRGRRKVLELTERDRRLFKG